MDSVFHQEQQRVNRVVQEIEAQILKLEKESSQRQKELVYTRKHFWDEIKVNIDSFDDFLETIIGLRQETQALSANQGTEKVAAQKLSKLRRMKDVPYFGRIDFLEEGEKAEEQVYIGISTLMDSDGEDFLVYDWRAPVSSVYYEYQTGPAAYSTPEGEVNGMLEKKVQYLIRDGVLQSMFDTSLTIGDEILQEVLGKGTDKHMHNIVATIQQEQNRIIRHDSGRLLVVQGAAGSGKTSAALQRIAYLLYKYRAHLRPDQIILFSPNSMFNSYVSNVLPELGEENMQQVTFQEYLDHRLSGEFHLENPYEQLEYVLTAANSPSYEARIAGIQFKASRFFFRAIESYRKSLELSGMQFEDVVFRGKPIVTAQQIAERFYEADTSLRFHNRLENLQNWLLQKIKETRKAEMAKPWVQEKIELLSDDEFHKAHNFLAKKSGLTGEAAADYEVTPEALARLIVQQKLKPLRKHVKALGFIDVKAIYKQLFSDSRQIHKWMEGEMPEEWQEICRVTLRNLDEGKLAYEDATPFLLLKELIQGFQVNSSIRHIIVDEAQDYSTFQFEFLKRLFPAARMTVLGDFNQAIFAHANEQDDFDALKSLYGPDQTELINMTRSYRSTKPIIEFTRKLVPNGEHIIPFERAGEWPAVTQVADRNDLHRSIESKIESFKSRGFNSVAVICKSAEESKQAYEGLSNIEDLKLIKSGTAEYEEGIVVIPTYLAKGIEFDAVIIYDASAKVYDDERLRRSFYTACTRAMHDLQLYSIGEATPLLKDAWKERFVRT
ncbi:RNA polymerase recycling motor HelD [Planococcus sp. YIM B11945]|uniref:RNA polymerase recycling motor HelD n=1 Tax=Planococcus sp. YIM B11945 TaxID=3435410 RepID=UPI003D7C9B94